jgi:hypothetical protein
MTIEQLRNAHLATPFRPFALHLSDGRTYRISHRDFLVSSPAGRTVIVFGDGAEDDGSFHIVDLLHVVEIEFEPQRN